jgi:hypothetical protein
MKGNYVNEQADFGKDDAMSAYGPKNTIALPGSRRVMTPPIFSA